MKKPLKYSVNFTASCLWLLAVAWPGAAVLAPSAVAGGGYAIEAKALLEQPPAGAEVAEDIEQALLMALNGYRAGKGRKALLPADQRYVDAARAQAFDLLQQGRVGHVSSGGYDFAARMRSLAGGGVQYLPVMAENAARDRRKGIDGAGKAEGLMQQWIDSPRHRKALTDRSYVAVATGVARRGDAVYAVQIFIGPQTKTNVFGGN